MLVSPIHNAPIDYGPSFHETLVNGRRLIVHATDFDAATQAYLTATGIRDTAAFVIDDVVRMLKGTASSTSLRGSTWTVLAANRWTNLKGAYLFQSALNASAGTTVIDLRANKNLAINGGMLWGADGFEFDGTDDALVGSASHITSGQWSALAVARGDASGKTLMSQNTASTNFRTTFMSVNASGFWGGFKRVDPTSYSLASTVAASTLTSILTVQTATDLKAYSGGSDTETGTIAVAATTIQNTDFIIGDVASGSSDFDGFMSLAMLFGENIISDYPEIHANLNALLGLGL